MAAICLLRVGFAAVLLTAVAGHLEYTAEMADTLHDYEDLVGLRARSLKYVPINPGYSVLMSRIMLPHDKGLHFYVQTHVLANKPIGVSSRGMGSSTPTPKPLGLPAIETALKKCLKVCEQGCCSLPTDNPRQLFNFKEMHFNIKQNRNLKPYMNLAVEFYDSTNNQGIEIVMQLFKPPTTQVDKYHAKDHKVPTIEPPIATQQLSKLFSRNEAPAKYENLNIVVDILWMEEVLRRARFDGTKGGDVATHYTEIYVAGPFIIDRKTFNNILKLEHDFQKYS